MKDHNINPPRWATRLLSWYCKPQLLEDLQGDLNEYFDRHVRKKGPVRARLIYVVDVIKFFRPYTVRTPEFINLLIHWIMIGSYVKTSGRSLVRNKLFSGINIIGLAISMSVGLLMISMLSDLLSYDSFHENKKSIYRVISDWQSGEREPEHLASTSLKAASRIRESVPGIEKMVVLRSGFSGDAGTDQQMVPLEGLYASEGMFDVFSFKLLRGDAATALKEPYSIVLTEQSAKKIFGNSEALGQTIKFQSYDDTSSYVITGIVRDIPKFSHMRFGALMSYKTYEVQEANDRNFMQWHNTWSDYIYMVVPPSHDIAALQAHLDRISAEENKALDNQRITLHLQQLKNIALGPDLSNPIGPTMIALVIWIIGGLTCIVILSACFNYTNLSIARSLRRAKEVGIRKVVGARRGHVLGQFIVEAILISTLALILSFGLFLLIRPHFISLAPELATLVSLDLSPTVVGAFLGFAVMVGILAGFLPALFFSKINAIQVLKDVSGMRLFKNVSMRRALIVVQYVFSLIFISATIIGYKQYKHALAFDLGFSTANILNIRVHGTQADHFEKLIREFPEVQGVSRSRIITSIGTHYGTQMKYNDPRDSSRAYFNLINEHYLPVHGHVLLAGRNLNPLPEGARESEAIVNEQVLKRFNIGTPTEAIGQIIKIEDLDLQIVGVMKDFHYGKVDDTIEPVVFRYQHANASNLNVKILSNDWPATLAALETAWKKVDPIHPMNAEFYDDQIDEAYSQFSVMVKILGFLALLAISIASLGLLGMVVFTTETRLKEMSIRKVLGATEGNLLYLLSRGFLLLLMIAALVALPLTYLFFDQVVLADIAYHAPITFGELIISVGVVMGIALLLIVTQTLKVARTNPATVLKNE